MAKIDCNTSNHIPTSGFRMLAEIDGVSRSLALCVSCSVVYLPQLPVGTTGHQEWAGVFGA